MANEKAAVLKTLQKSWKKYWGIGSLKQFGFRRFICKKCGKAYWATQEQKACNDSSCRPYDFIGNPVGKKMDYFQTWQAIEKFFVKEGHTPLKRYPTVCRWYPLYFTIAGIVDFYRMDGDKLMFEFPANPSILAQPCLRFNDIANVGVTGKHFTCFNMVQQSALYDGKKGYWKDKCMDLDYRLLTDVFKINPSEINFIEDAWFGHGAFGYSLEYHIRGLEIGNAVFTEFVGTPKKFSVMKEKIIDMGAGHERFTWLTNGTNTIYDCVFGSVIEEMKGESGVSYDPTLFTAYSKLAGQLNMDEVADVETARREVAKRLGVTTVELKKKVEPMQALYAIADHSKALLFALADGGLPSNVGGGYNLRVILRRALSFIDRFGFPFDLVWAAERNAEYLKPMNPELAERLPQVTEILQAEEKRYKNGLEKAKRTVDIAVAKGGLTEEKIIELYDSHGITPELLQEAAEKRNVQVKIPADLYAKVSERHMKREREKAAANVNVAKLPATKKLYYQDMKMTSFEATVLKIIDGKHVVLDRSAFYPRGGGQEPDHGTIGGHNVFDVEKSGDVIIHSVENPKFKVGAKVTAEIDAARRKQITIHHDATHIINAAARAVLGPWVWQEGSKKDVDKAHLDVDHYDALTEGQVKKIEEAANKMVQAAVPIEKFEMERTEAEKKFGFIIYQGAAVPSKTLRITKVGQYEVEACGGTHGDNTSEIGQIIIVKTERPADGTVRFVYKAGPAAEAYDAELRRVLKESAELLGVEKESVPAAAASLIEKWRTAKKNIERLRLNVAEKRTADMDFAESKGMKILVEKVPNADVNQLREISRKMSADNTIILLFGLSDRIYVFGSAGEKAVKAGADIGKAVLSACATLGGKGGGTAMLAQGSGTDNAKLNEALKKAKELLWI